MKQSNDRPSSGAYQRGPSYTPEQIRQHVRDFQRSGQSVAAFARQCGIKYHMLRRWLQRQRIPVRAAASAEFQAMPLSSLLGPAWAAEVVAPNGLIVRLSPQAPVSLGLELVALSVRL